MLLPKTGRLRSQRHRVPQAERRRRARHGRQAAGRVDDAARGFGLGWLGKCA